MLASKLLLCFHQVKLHIADRIGLAIGRAKASKEWPREPLVSIVIPTYNRSKILCERTIPSILNQTYQNFEILVVGDHVIDDTAVAISKIADNRVRFYDLPDRGRYPSDPKQRWFVQGTVPRNKSHQLLRGDCIACLSDDDIVFPNYLDALVKEGQRSNAEFITAAYEAVINGVKVRCGSEVGLKGVGFESGGMQTWLYRSYLKCFSWNTQSWRKSWNRPTDYDLIIRMKNAGVTFSYTDEVVAFTPPANGTNTTGIAAAQ
jgi:glycosyltransferase involved in cell wall biosynthesis